MKNFNLLLIPIILFGVIAGCSRIEEEMDRAQQEKELIPLYGQKSEYGAQTRAVALKNNLWEPGQTITVKFLNGTEDQHSKVRQYAVEWMEYANIHFEFVDSSEPADIRVGFQYRNETITWSVVGTAALTYPASQPTMNFGVWHTNERRIKGDILMQFGHVLGLVNEHQGLPYPTLILYEEAIYDEYFERGWTVQQTTDFFFTPYRANQTHKTVYDDQSIMCWPIEGYLTTSGVGQAQNYELSNIDKSFISTIYPPAAKPYFSVNSSEVRINYNTTGSTISVSSNTDWTVTKTSGIFLTLNTTSGTGDGTVRFTTTQNPNYATRGATLRFSYRDENNVLKTETVTITQDFQRILTVVSAEMPWGKNNNIPSAIGPFTDPHGDIIIRANHEDWEITSYLSWLGPGTLYRFPVENSDGTTTYYRSYSVKQPNYLLGQTKAGIARIRTRNSNGTYTEMAITVKQKAPENYFWVDHSTTTVSSDRVYRTFVFYSDHNLKYMGRSWNNMEYVQFVGPSSTGKYEYTCLMPGNNNGVILKHWAEFRSSKTGETFRLNITQLAN